MVLALREITSADRVAMGRMIIWIRCNVMRLLLTMGFWFSWKRKYANNVNRRFGKPPRLVFVRRSPMSDARYRTKYIKSELPRTTSPPIGTNNSQLVHICSTKREGTK